MQTLINIHAAFGVIVLVAVIILAVRNVIRLTGNRGGKSYRAIVTGLIDLEVLVGIITFIVHPIWNAFLLHPITMIVAAGAVHALTREKCGRRAQIAGYVLAVILLLLGVEFGRMF